MSDDEDRFELRSKWIDFMMEEIVREIVKSKGEPLGEIKIIKLASSDVDDDTKYRFDIIKAYFVELSETAAIKAAKKAIESAIELIPIFAGSGDKMDEILKQTYDLINDADNEMKKVEVGKEFLMGNLKKSSLSTFGSMIVKTIYISDLSEDKRKECLDAVNKILDNKTKIDEDDKNLVINKINEYLNPSSPQPVQPDTPKLQPGPLHISIKGNKYSVGSKNDDSHEMTYDNVTKCWKEQVSGGATKSKKKRGPKSRPKSRAKSRRY